ncbi:MULTISPECIES: DUF1656 domain-containing protein [Agarivorans]|uniref:DUF1656 domain-containing protein n=1 Tax=Agarivorans gilvus TaxID=680279 RepID=A0ABQ1I662_9ALTE|nr:DUF1656 domain-containing protein [Agarivorans gilvus]GGB20534.1 hypothetical protein GCM10007414_37460 [Agarivorans gilvus]
MSSFIPKELALGEVYLPPLLMVVCLGYLLARFSMLTLARLNLQRYIVLPALVELCFTTIFSVLLSFFVIPS